MYKSLSKLFSVFFLHFKFIILMPSSLQGFCQVICSGSYRPLICDESLFSCCILFKIFFFIVDFQHIVIGFFFFSLLRGLLSSFICISMYFLKFEDFQVLLFQIKSLSHSFFYSTRLLQCAYWSVWLYPISSLGSVYFPNFFFLLRIDHAKWCVLKLDDSFFCMFG